MARKQDEDAALVAEAKAALAEGGEISSEELRAELDLDQREVGTVVDAPVIPFERRKDGSIAYFTQEQAALLREVGS